MRNNIQRILDQLTDVQASTVVAERQCADGLTIGQVAQIAKDLRKIERAAHKTYELVKFFADTNEHYQVTP